MTKTVCCPNCQTPVIWSPENPWRPFCSERCKLIDLGAWADGSHAIPDYLSIPDENDFEDLQKH